MVVLGNLELLRRRHPDDPRIQRLAENAVQGAQRGATLTQRMLAFARRQELKPAAVDIPILVQGMSELLQRSLGPGAQVETHFPPQLPRALVDANQLELAILNLAVNARDAMPEGGKLSITADSEKLEAAEAAALAPCHYIRLLVTGTGVGMDEVKQAPPNAISQKPSACRTFVRNAPARSSSWTSRSNRFYPSGT